MDAYESMRQTYHAQLAQPLAQPGSPSKTVPVVSNWPVYLVMFIVVIFLLLVITRTRCQCDKTPHRPSPTNLP